MKANLKTARKIIETFTVNVHDYPDYLIDNGNSETCERNMKVAQCLMAIDDLQKSL